jgi:hypothetical protein
MDRVALTIGVIAFLIVAAALAWMQSPWLFAAIPVGAAAALLEHQIRH